MSKQITLEDIQNFEGKYPKQLWYLFLVEMWERFCFYGMRGVLAIFMVDQLLLTEKDANLKYGAIQAFVYAFTFVGGIFADKILGFKRSLTFGAVLMVLGNGLIAIDPHQFFYFGIALTIIGTGFFKPNISSMVGDLYREGDSRRDAGFGVFYSGINVGALLGGALCVWLGKEHSWNLAFLAAAIVMLIGLLIFTFTKKHLGPIGNSPLVHLSKAAKIRREVMVYAGALICIPLIFIMVNNTRYTDLFMYIVGPLALVYFLFQLLREKERSVRQQLIAALILILFSILFFAIFEQAGGSLALFANNNLQHDLLFFQIDPNVVNNGANSLFVIVFSPLLGLLWLALAKKKLEPNTVVKFGLGFLFLAIGYYIFFGTRLFADATGKTSLEVFTLAYLAVTIGELCLSPIGLSMITKLSPRHLGGMMMGLWFLASAYGQYVAGLLGAGMSSPDENASLFDKLIAYTDGYQQLAIYSLVAGVVLVVLSPAVRKLMNGVS
ncbi:POT family proton-dependent oligopeptide transporter [Sphingobacterium allocomposti]|jgi:POT family proton-dependent oligopeptide transporter|uniref:POT family proton-dependent oligopeptide transporter n=1 Tax=Sphingobacterium allocomposti TaxID=415956 RepID=A0A5S5DI82_9SPHI|nr:peptide MFS transporter [Sphingobacterium composti Yoo et al. 2007 non Ten et al. 2007]TYP94359.1 POT family proton-dependent oligopeptide transporter [Sphingobacterium composti Yoo et al. 2007 non Ten et al. 2007]HLS94416.1 peptide MFS transporter [Sphingobacterium sp.]